MCGIGGFSIARGEAARADRDAMIRALLRDLESRGRDAAGVAWRSAASGETYYQKAPYKGSRFASELHRSARHAAAAIVHTRFATQGSPEDERNNHPIYLPGIVGVHNGCLANDDEIIEALGHERVGEVDSEAAFALLAEGPAVFPDASPGDLLGMVEGTMALAWLAPEEERPSLWLARGAGSPLWLGWSKGGTLVFASTRQAVERAAKAGGLSMGTVREVQPGWVLRIAGGQVQEEWQFTPESAGRRPRSDYSERSAFEPSRREQRRSDRVREYFDWARENSRFLDDLHATEDEFPEAESHGRSTRSRRPRADWPAGYGQRQASKRGEILFGPKRERSSDAPGPF